LIEGRQAELIRDFFGGKKDGFFVDVGAHRPRHNSLSWPLEQEGWRGILVEPQKDLCERLRSERPRSTVFQVAAGAPEQRGSADLELTTDKGHAGLRASSFNPTAVVIGTESVDVRTLDELLAEAGAGSVDFVSIDVEGTELDVLKGFDLDRYRPTLVLLEDIVDSLDKHLHMRSRGYRIIRRTGLNNWYVPKDARERASLREWLRLIRKLYVGFPTRKLKWWLRRRRAARRRAGKP